MFRALAGGLVLCTCAVVAGCGPDSSVTISHNGDGGQVLAVGEETDLDRLGIVGVDDDGVVTVNVPSGLACEGEEVAVHAWVRFPDWFVINVATVDRGDCDHERPTRRSLTFLPDPRSSPWLVQCVDHDCPFVVESRDALDLALD